MGYFKYISDKSFGVSPSGERLFYPNGPWSRPFVITSETSESELRRKNLWLTRLSLGPIFVGLPILGVIQPSVMRDPRLFVGLLTALLLLNYVLRKAVLRPDLTRLPRVASASPLKDFYRSMAVEHGLFGLVAGFVACVAFVILGTWMYQMGTSPLISLPTIAFFALCGLAWGYTIYLKIWVLKR